ncbi:serine/threonine protein kinase [Microbacterium sp. KUDC0406]|uniref:serine/threonine-protein kinase n=1 Tax=Microbacterium sp. KUDC0406 TaxID=2909588 RepID=UPI001F47658B|nr:serine/threonine-protein kinase [Microbacterium sp. KUDC0406]UJP09182.1 serine/threonine protein kinase [Microbacterium sp. KUDC0406]
MSRPPSAPPALPGFTYLDPLGTGGFADVFLYEQEMPRRKVAVKVLLADRITDSAAAEFADEANVMAMLSTHPAIVTIYQAGVAGDGRPYLVMEYCPRPNLQLRARRERFSVAEALRVGIQVAGAVETAHRAGVLHRDIKPANILVTEYNRPALTDFGIASTTQGVGEATGMSIPWSPPESFADPPTATPRSDVWALGATVYTLLTGRSPFEQPGGRNSGADLIERIERSALPPLARADAPGSLQTALETAMAKNPGDRFPSAVAFARALQKVQIELSHSVTPVDIVDDQPHDGGVEEDDDGLTRVREIVSIDPTRPSATTERKRPVPASPAGDVPAGTPAFTTAAAASAADPSALETTVQRAKPTDAAPAAPLGEDDDRTMLRAPRVLTPDAPAPQSPPVAPAAAGTRGDGGGAAGPPPWHAVVGLGRCIRRRACGHRRRSLVRGRSAAEPGGAHTGEVRSEAGAAGSDLRAGAAGRRSEGRAQGRSGGLHLDEPRPAGRGLVHLAAGDARGTGDSARTEETTATIPAQASGPTCIEVTLRRDAGRSSDPLRECTP